jgi:DNA-directed RNA polymerase beta subunit/DNA-directed RNA polymerase beta' subunit
MLHYRGSRISFHSSYVKLLGNFATMAHILNIPGSEKELQENVIGSVKSFFPIESKTRTLKLQRVYPGKPHDTNDISSQETSKNNGRTWGYPVYADIDLVDKTSGKVIDSASKVRLLNLPQLTSRFSYIVGGVEYQPSLLWRLKSGVYGRKTASGMYESHFNLAEGQGFRMNFLPEKKKFELKYGTSNLALLPVLKTLGISDAKIKETWGEEILRGNHEKDETKALIKAAKALDYKSNPESRTEAEDIIRSVYAKTVLRPDSTQETLGKGFTSVNGEALLRASQKLLNINRGTESVDNRDSLQFKELWSTEDMVPERIMNSSTRINRKLQNGLDKRDEVKKILTPDVFDLPIKTFFTSSAISQQPPQVNPLGMINSRMKTTLLGQGGISTPHQVSLGAKLIDPSHLGILDPVATPEGQRSGITLHLGLGVQKDGHQAKIHVFDRKLGKRRTVAVEELSKGLVAFPDQYSWKDDKPTALKKDVIAVGQSDPELVKADKVDFVLLSSTGMFSITSNMLPFLPSLQANRAEMAVRHLEQSIPLKDREAPLVQVHTGNKNKNETWEEVTGRFVSNLASTDGVVSEVTAKKIKIKSKDGKTHTVDIYDNFPLNDVKAFISSTPIVKKGDAVKAGQVVADSNYTKNGVLALGTNLRTAFMPWKYGTFEDARVISESAAKKLTSEHLYKERLYEDDSVVLNKKKFQAQFPSALNGENSAKLDDAGVVKIGQKVTDGDILVTAIRKLEPSTEQLLLKGLGRGLAKDHSNASVVWHHPYEGTVVNVIKHGRTTLVHVKTEEPAQIGDKLSSRSANKGVISHIIPDDEMPRDKDGNAIELILSPMGVPGRINPSQVHELKLGKVAAAQGSSFAIKNFAAATEKKIIKVAPHWRTVQTADGPKQVFIEGYEYERGYSDLVDDELKEAGISETEELFDPENGKSLGQILTGNQFTLKLMHQVDKKNSFRAHGAGYDYDASGIPKSGGAGAAMQYGGLGTYAMLAHGSTANVRESLTWKSDKNQSEVWEAIQTNQLLPATRPSFAYERFIGYLNALGVDVEKEGSKLILNPLTDVEILARSKGELTSASRVLRGKDLQPESGGLFDEKLTGGASGTNWTHIGLATPMPNPMFESSILALLGITGKQFNGVLAGREELGGSTGPSAIVDALRKIDVKEELAEAEKKILTARSTELNAANKKLKYLRMLDREGVTAEDAYILKNLPVLPPVFRPISVLESGDLSIDGLNFHYRNVALVNDKLNDAKGFLPPEEIAKFNYSLYDSVSNLMAVGPKSRKVFLSDGDEAPPGVIGILEGKTPKTGFIQSKLLTRKQDLTGRSIVTPDGNLHLDELRIPRKGAMVLFEPFVVSELTQSGLTPLKAKREIELKSALANKALDIAISKRPILMKRDPALHKYSVQAFNVKLGDGLEIGVNPFVVGGFNMDFDGDAVSLFVPISKEAVEESYKMMPSRNIFNPSSGRVAYTPSLEGQIGLFLLTQMGKKTDKKFSTLEAAVESYKKGDLAATDIVTAGGNVTTPGRALMYLGLPKDVRDTKYLTDKDLVLHGKTISGLLSEVGKTHPEYFGRVADHLKTIGFGYTHQIGFSFKAGDFKALSSIRDKHIRAAEVKVAALPGNLSSDKRNKVIVDTYKQATDAINKDAKSYLKKSGNSLFTMHSAGTKPSWSQIQQLIIAPMLVTNAQGSIIPVPITRSYAEGVSASGYWVASSGARKGLIDKVQSVSIPGALTKQIQNMVMHSIITEEDCKTSNGIALAVDDFDLPNRILATPLKLRSGTISAGSILTPKLLGQIKESKTDKIVVRSPLKCESSKGMCSKCYGKFTSGKLPKVGTNIGVIAGGTIGERGTQLSMRCNSADTLITIRRGENLPETVDIKSLYDRLDGIYPAKTTQSGVQTIEPDRLEIYDGHNGWVDLNYIQKHPRDKDLEMLFAKSQLGGFVVSLENHPLWVVPKLGCKCHTPKVRQRSFSPRGLGVKCNTCKREWIIGKSILNEAERKQLGSLRESPKDFYAETDFRLFQRSGEIEPEIDGYLAGFYGADGSCRYGNGTPAYEGIPVAVLFSFGKQDSFKSDNISKTLLSLGIKHSEVGDSLEVYDIDLANQFSCLVQGKSIDKTLKSDFINYTDEWLADFLCGYIDGDGTLVERCATKIKINTSSFKMLQVLQIICVKLGIRATPGVSTFREECCNVQPWHLEFRVTSENEWVFDRCSKWMHSERNLTTNNNFLPSLALSELTLVREIEYHHDFVYDVTTSSGAFLSGTLRNSNTFHTGGAVGGDSGLTGALDRVIQILKMPKQLPGSTKLAPSSGIVSGVTSSPAGGYDLKVGSENVYIPSGNKLIVKKGDKVKKGSPLSSGIINPRELLELTDMDTVRRYLSDELYNVYKSEGIKRRNVEVVVRSLTDLGEVEDAGDSDEFIRGDYASLNYIAATNSKLKNPVRITPVLRGVGTLPIDQTEDWIARLNYQKLKETLKKGANQGWRSDIHGNHPTPGITYSAELGKGATY